MREHLYRAKRTDNGEWVYGNLIETREEYSDEIVYAILEKTAEHRCMGEYCDNGWYAVDRKTVCEYTGLTDRNGNKIFEDDILKADVLCNTCGASPKPIYIHFADGAFCWAENKNNEKDTLALCDSEHFRDLKLYEVIGNIYDNIELMEQK